MKLRRFCSKCGDSVQATQKLYDHYMCEKCYISQHGIDDIFIFPNKIKLRICKECGAFSLIEEGREYKWRFKPEETGILDFLTTILYEDIFIPIEKKKSLHYDLFLKQDLSLEDPKDIEILVKASRGVLEKEEIIFIRTRKINCAYCANIIGGRFDSVLQIRIQHPRHEIILEEILNECKEISNRLRRKNPENYIAKINKTPNGFDLQLSNNKIQKTLTSILRNQYRFEFILSNKLMGVNSETGTDLYRYYVSLKLVPVEKNDQIILDGETLLIETLTDNKIIARNQKTDETLQINYDIFAKKKWRLLNE